MEIPFFFAQACKPLFNLLLVGIAILALLAILVVVLSTIVAYCNHKYTIMSILIDNLTTNVPGFYATIIDMCFNDWLLFQVREQNLSQSDLAKKSKLSRQAISNYFNGRIPNEAALKKLAHALHLSNDIIFRAAGLLPPKPAANEISEQAEYIINNYRYPETKERALSYLEFLRIEEEKGEYRVSPARRPANAESG